MVSGEDGSGLPGATVLIKGTTTGTITDLDGAFKMKASDGDVITFTYVGMQSQEMTVGSGSSYNATLKPGVNLNEVVVTALGVSREKKSLGYATQEISGDEVNTAKSGNFMNQMSGKLAGVNIKQNNNFGGSTNIIIRGSSSLTGNNQALFVVDGIIMDNSNHNTSAQTTGGSGFDYGSKISDINPNDIETMNVLRGAAATALYGARAANGVVIITTKKGTRLSGKNAIGVTVNSNVTMGVIDKSTFVKYQDKYGQGYGYYYDDPSGQFFYEDVDGDGNPDLVTPYTEDGSYGAAFDPNLNVYNWDAFVPESPNFGKATPWVAAENGPDTFFDKAYSFVNSVSLQGGGDKGVFRISYTNTEQTGIMPNSKLSRNNFAFNSEMNMTDKLTISATGNYINNQGKGRNSTGYGNNLMANYRQWWATNVDLQALEELYDQTGANITWNPASSSDPRTPIFWNNPYFQVNESFQTDERNRFYGNMVVNYEFSKKFSILARSSVDTYSEIFEERLAVGSVPDRFGISRLTEPSGYARTDRTFTEFNYDLIGTYNTRLSEDISFRLLGGMNVRRTRSASIFASTNGGLVVPGLYSMSNTVNPSLPAVENNSIIGVNGIYANASFGYKDKLYVDITGRNDVSSTLPAANNSYFYPSVALSYLFAENINKDWLDFGKVRLNYASVGNDAPFAVLQDTYTLNPSFQGNAQTSVNNNRNNPDLKPEISTSFEAGLEMVFFHNRLGFDFATYKTNTVDQIFNVAVSTATGYSSKYVNAGEVQNKGMELSLYGTPVKTADFSWLVNVNWSRNRNEVISLFDGVDNLQLGSFQGGVTINATVGEPYGTIQGTDYVYLNGERVVGTNGYYLKTSTADNVIGNVNPDFIMGLGNTFTYKNWRLNTLIDWKQGGDLFSLDLYYGLATGLYEETAEDGYRENGVILDGVQADGSTNDVLASTSNFGTQGYRRNPNAAFVYDASYVKLREVSLTYTFPAQAMENSVFAGASFGLVGNNLWIISKNLPHADPEAGTTSGNLQGWQSGVLPTTRNFGFNLTLQF